MKTYPALHSWQRSNILRLPSGYSFLGVATPGFWQVFSLLKWSPSWYIFLQCSCLLFTNNLRHLDTDIIPLTPLTTAQTKMAACVLSDKPCFILLTQISPIFHPREHAPFKYPPSVHSGPGANKLILFFDDEASNITQETEQRLRRLPK